MQARHGGLGKARGRLSEQTKRLVDELEQARVTAEAAQDELTAVARQRDEALCEVRRLRAESDRARSAAAELKGSLLRRATPEAEAVADAESRELEVAIEELLALTEELEVTNARLIEVNHELDRRVAERTAALEEANRELEQINQELRARVEQETAARLATQTRLFQAQKLEAVGQLTGGIAHDFNNLLTVITSGLQLLSNTKDPERQERLIRRIEEAAWRGADLTRRLLAFARRQPLNPQRLDLGGHIEGLRELLNHGLRDDIQIETEVPTGLWPAEADLAALELALLNLAVNARDAMVDGGTMVLGARNIARDSRLSERLGLPARDYIELFVSDTGSGMEPEVLSRVFEPFFTTKPPGKGTGLGLAQVHGFAHQSGGTARVESSPGRGTKVSIYIPRSEQAEGPAAPSRSPAAPRPERVPDNLAVLVVEDDDEVAAVVLDMLAQLGHRGHRVSTLAAAVAVLSGGQRVDLVFTDVLLAGSGSGLDLAREVARRRLPVPIVLTSGYGGGVTGRLAAARLPFLRKPYSIAALKTALAQAIGVEGVGNE
jgi:signal transduction histidine kinase